MPTPLKTISDLATLIPGFSPKPAERKRRGQYLLLGGRNIKGGKLVRTDADSYVDGISRESFRRAIALPGDIVVSTLFDRRKLYVYTEDAPPAVINNSCAIIRSGKQSDYIISYLRTMEGERDFLEKASNATGGSIIPRLSIKDLANIQIPILPFPELERLGDARLEKATDSELLDLKAELKSKDAEIAKLKADQEETARFWQDRIRAVEEQLETNSLASRIKHGETATLEFKSSLRWNIRANRMDKNIENAVLKTVAAFCNTAGGELLIGVADNGDILGINHDGFPNSDKFLLHFRNLLLERIGADIVESIEYKMASLNEQLICHVICKPSKKEVWFRADSNSPWLFYVRLGPSSTELPTPKAVEYIRNHFDQGR